ncbi:MAG: hypothetical protein KO202_00840 [Methanobacteriaceae archaeon]|jgi:hypothetical protein|nr:hypothetical protein [Methanobacteriaceae archaeon]
MNNNLKNINKEFNETITGLTPQQYYLTYKNLFKDRNKNAFHDNKPMKANKSDRLMAEMIIKGSTKQYLELLNNMPNLLSDEYNEAINLYKANNNLKNTLHNILTFNREWEFIKTYLNSKKLVSVLDGEHNEERIMDHLYEKEEISIGIASFEIISELWLKEPFNYVFITILGETDYNYYINKIKIFENLKKNNNTFKKLLNKGHKILKKICKQKGIDIKYNTSVSEFEETIAEYGLDKFKKETIESKKMYSY